MTKRLQVLVDDEELAEIQRAARHRRMTVAEWVRQSLRASREADAGPSTQAKLEAIRRAMTYSFPTADIEQMLEETARGRGDPHLP